MTEQNHPPALTQTLKGLWARFIGAFTLWRLLTLSSIIFAAGISGTWFNDQFKDDLQKQRWGWFGAVIAGVAIFGGVMLAVDSLEPLSIKRNDKETDEEWEKRRNQAELIRRIELGIGIGLMLIGAIADCAMSANYFADGHDPLTAIILGFYPSLLSIMGGVIEGVRGIRARNMKRVQEERDVEVSIMREVELAKIQARKEIAIAKLNPPSSANVREQSPSSVNNRALTLEDMDALRIIRQRFGESFTSAQAEEASPFQRTKTHELLSLAADAGKLEKEGRGKWRWK